MQIINRKTFHLMVIFTMILSVFTPLAAFANEGTGPKVIGSPTDAFLTIYKYEEEPGTDTGAAGDGSQGQQPTDAKPLQGVEFTLTKTHTFNPDTNEWTEVSGEGETLIGVTNEAGKLTFASIDLGRYEVKETDGPAHVNLNEETFYVDIPMTNKAGNELNYHVYIYPKNETIRGAVELTKKDQDGNNLSGAQFDLYKKSSSSETPDEKVNDEPLTTDSQGKIIYNGLAFGDYYFVETKAPTYMDGQNQEKSYALDQTPIEFTIKNSGNIQEDGTRTGEVVEAEHTNNKTPEVKKEVAESDGAGGQGHLNIDREKEFVFNITITTPADISQYKKLGVYDLLDDRLTFIEDGSIADGWRVTGGTTKDNIEFTREGQKLSWFVKDFAKVTQGEDIVITFTTKVKGNAELIGDETGIPNTASLEFDNDRGEESDEENPPTSPPVIVTPLDGGFKIIKVEKGNKTNRLQGAEFKLTTDQAGKDVVNAEQTVIKVNGSAHDGLLQGLLTNENGEILIEGLTPGTYYLHETKAPIDPNDGETYRLLTSPVKIQIKADQTDHQDVTVENSKTGWNLPATGGIGTILFSILGLILMVGALYFYFRKDSAKQTL